MKFGIAYGALLAVIGSRLWSNVTSPDVAEVMMIVVVAAIYAAIPVSLWAAIASRRRS